MLAVLTRHRRWLVGLLAVLLVAGVASRAMHPDRGRDATLGGTDGHEIAGHGATTPTPSGGASGGLLSPFAPVLDVVVMALEGSEADADVGRCGPHSWDSATRHVTRDRPVTVVVRDGGYPQTRPTSDATGAPGPGALPC